jgi:CRISPR-associated protein Cmr1
VSTDPSVLLSAEESSTDVFAEPEPRARRLSGGPPMASLRVRLRTTTPILGGSSAPRELDKRDPIRAPSIRGHLRFWWRALHAHAYATSAELASRERELWGGVGRDAGTRSRVELRVAVEPDSLSEDPSEILPKTQGAYALWVASSQKDRGEGKKPPAPRWKPALGFWLHIRAPADRLIEVEHSLRAWVLWGGYGSRTRRGLGSLTVVDEREIWLPRQPTRAEWSRLFPGSPLFGALPPEGARQVPLLRGARLVFGTSRRDAEGAWEVALGWLREFRQGEGRFPPGSRMASPRKPGDSISEVARELTPGRPGRSYWPEADKVRQLFAHPKGKSWAHVPRSQYRSPAAAWPRAGFGLPLALRFQRSARPTRAGEKGLPYDEPPDIELKWHDGQGVRERFASPLIVKAMPLADGTFVPIALWLRRAWPSQGRVVLVGGKHSPLPGRDASSPFERLLAPGDTALYAPLLMSNLEEAFLDWVKGFRGVKESL